MKLKLEFKEAIYHSIDIDTCEYGSVEGDDPFSLAEFINKVKCNPKDYANSEGAVTKNDSDIENLTLTKSNE